jgi:N-acetylglucosamine-6-phosphate deacetylase
VTRLALSGARIFDGETTRERHSVIIAEGRIDALVGAAEVDHSLECRDLGGGLLAPGFIDAQVNGGGGVLFNCDPSVDGLRQIAEAHRRFGTTGLLPTIISDTPEVMRGAADAVAAARRANVPGILGIHFEGPFIDERRRGAHPEGLIRPMTADDLVFFRDLDCGRVLVTLAPSRVPPAFVRELTACGAIVSLGHAEATADEATAALEAGATGFTHLFNAMSPLGHRAPGMVGAALAFRESFCGIIADGHHVDPIALKVAIAAKPKGRIFLVSDAMPSAAGGPDRFSLHGREVRLESGRLTLSDGTLAGSNITMDAAIRYCCRELGTPLGEALRMASLYPARFLELDHERGRIAPGYRADLVHLSDMYEVRETWIGGESYPAMSISTSLSAGVQQRREFPPKSQSPMAKSLT